MKLYLIWLIVVFCDCSLCAADRPKNSAMPERLLIARHTFVDFGPPTDFYEIISIRPTASGLFLERVTLTPAADACVRPATVEIASSPIPDSLSALLEGRNPCAIPNKAFRKELKRRKRGLVFSGAEVSMYVQCGRTERIIRADVLDRDLFDPNAATPENTSWTMRLLDRLDRASSGGVWDRPVFADLTESPRHAIPNSDTATALATGQYDRYFNGTPDRPSDLYRASLISAPIPDVVLRASVPFQPEEFIRPDYPPLARLAHIEGNVVVTFQVDGNGGVTDTQFETGHPMLRGTVDNAVKRWKFPKQAANQRITATIAFKTNCPKTQ